jgi:hypothetical protein
VLTQPGDTIQERRSTTHATLLRLLDEAFPQTQWKLVAPEHGQQKECYIALADPMREIAQWLCWYVAQDQWPAFFARYGCALDQALVDRLFWWSARASFANAIWHLGRRYPHAVIVRDCWDALRREIAPHQVFAGA